MNPALTWPDVLPLPNFSLTGENVPSVVRKETDDGRTRQRQRFTGEVETFAVEFNFDNTEFAIFRGLWKHRLNGGTSWFNIRMPVGAFEEFTTVAVRFTKGYGRTYQPHMRWLVRCELELFDNAVINEDALALLLSGDSVEEFRQNVDALANIFPKDWEQ